MLLDEFEKTPDGNISAVDRMRYVGVGFDVQAAVSSNVWAPTTLPVDTWTPTTPDNNDTWTPTTPGTGGWNPI